MCVTAGVLERMLSCARETWKAWLCGSEINYVSAFTVLGSLK